MLMILDGYGYNPREEGNAIAQAKKPFLDSIFAKYPHALLGASGQDVGLPDGQMGNSEVGHLNIGAGRIVYQELTRITKAIEDGPFFENEPMSLAMENAVKKGGAVHVMGLLSDGGVHSHIDHLKAINKMAKQKNVEKLYLHAFLDGRDVPPRCAEVYIKDIEAVMAAEGVGQIATVAGRYYAMDRDNRWERVSKAYEAIVNCKGREVSSGLDAVKTAYENDENDEFVIPSVVVKDAGVHDGDSVIMFNFRPDRAREITRALVDPEFTGFEREKINDLTYVCMTQYDATMPNVMVAYPPTKLSNTLGEYVASKGLNQLRIAETEKYAHVTFFFNGGVEEPNKNEDRKLIPSPKVATYDLQPEMSAYQVTDAVLEAIGEYDLIILNFANADMVGHTGVIEAATAAVEALDGCVEKIANKILEVDGQMLLTADHGNADVMIDEEGNIVTSHSLNRVPVLHLASEPREVHDGKLCDLSPTLLEMLGLEQPDEMTGTSLFK